MSFWSVKRPKSRIADAFMAEKKSRKRSDLRFIHTVKFREQAPGLILSKGPF